MNVRVIPLESSRKEKIAGLRADAKKAREEVQRIHAAIEGEISFAVADTMDDIGAVKRQQLSDCGQYVVVNLYASNEKRKQSKGSKQ